MAPPLKGKSLIRICGPKAPLSTSVLGTKRRKPTVRRPGESDNDRPLSSVGCDPLCPSPADRRLISHFLPGIPVLRPNNQTSTSEVNFCRFFKKVHSLFIYNPYKTCDITFIIGS